MRLSKLIARIEDATINAARVAAPKLAAAKNAVVNATHRAVVAVDDARVEIAARRTERKLMFGARVMERIAERNPL